MTLFWKTPSFWASGETRFVPYKTGFLAQLSVIFREITSRERSSGTQSGDQLARSTTFSDQSELLAELLMDSDDKQFSVIYPKFEEQGERVLSFVASEIRKELLPVTTDWTVRFHKWEKVGQNSLPADWEAVLKSPILDQLRMHHLNIQGATNPPSPPTPKVPKDYFFAVWPPRRR